MHCSSCPFERASSWLLHDAPSHPSPAHVPYISMHFTCIAEKVRHAPLRPEVLRHQARRRASKVEGGACPTFFCNTSAWKFGQGRGATTPRISRLFSRSLGRDISKVKSSTYPALLASARPSHRHRVIALVMVRWRGAGAGHQGHAAKPEA